MKRSILSSILAFGLAALAGDVVMARTGPPSHRPQRRAADVSPPSRNLADVAARIRSERCNLLLVGDSIASSFAFGERGTWVTGIWRSWQPEQWRGRFIPAAMHGIRSNGTTVSNGGIGPAFDPACRRISGSAPAHPGKALPPYFDTGGWGLLVEGFETLGDLGDRSLAQFLMPSQVDGIDYWARYREDSNWAGGALSANLIMVATPQSVPRYLVRGRRSDDVWTATTEIDLTASLPGQGTHLVEVPFEFENLEEVSSSNGTLAIELRTDPLHEEEAGQCMMFLGCVVEQPSRDTGLLLGSHSVGGDTTGSHLAEGDLLQTDGSLLQRFYDDDYLREFIKAGEWNTFVVTLGSNDLNALQRTPQETVAGISAVIDRYRTISEQVRAEDASVLPAEFLIITPATAGSAARTGQYAELDLALGALAGDDVAVVHLHALLTEAVGTWGDYESQLLVDGTHPDETGSMMKAELVWREIERVLELPPSEPDGPLRLVPGEYATIAEAVSAAEPDEVVLIGPGSHLGGIVIDVGRLDVRTTHGAETTFVDGTGTSQCMAITADSEVRVRDLGFRNGRAAFGAGLSFTGGDLFIEGCRFDDCEATASGGAVQSTGGHIEIIGTIMDSCAAGDDGGGIAIFGGTASLESTVIRRCFAGGDGGGVSSTDAATNLVDLIIRQSEASRGGAIHTAGGFLDLRDSLLELNASVVSGGGIDFFGSSVNVQASLLKRNFSEGIGGGIAIRGGDTIEIRDLEATENSAGDRGGAIAASDDANVSIYGSIFQLNQAGSGGGGFLVACADVTITSCLLESLSAPVCNAAEVICGSLSLGGDVICPDADGFCGTITELGGNEYPGSCEGICEGDLNLDGAVDGGDLGFLFAAWGDCPPNSFCRADLNRDGFVNGGDLGVLLSILGVPFPCE